MREESEERARERESERETERRERKRERVREGMREGGRARDKEKEKERERRASAESLVDSEDLPPKMSKDVRTIWVVPEASTGQAGTAAAAVPLLVVAPSLFASPPKFLAFQIEIVKQKSTFPSYG
jgi:hypothetical protein